MESALTCCEVLETVFRFFDERSAPRLGAALRPRTLLFKLSVLEIVGSKVVGEIGCLRFKFYSVHQPFLVGMNA